MAKEFDVDRSPNPVDLHVGLRIRLRRKELGVSQSMLHRWRERFGPELPGGAQGSQGEREEIERLRRELRDLLAENSLLKKAAALFAKDVK